MATTQTPRRSPATGTATPKQMWEAIDAPMLWSCCQNKPEYVGVWGDGSGRCIVLCASCGWTFKAAGNTTLEIPWVQTESVVEATVEPVERVMATPVLSGTEELIPVTSVQVPAPAAPRGRYLEMYDHLLDEKLHGCARFSVADTADSHVLVYGKHSRLRMVELRGPAVWAFFVEMTKKGTDRKDMRGMWLVVNDDRWATSQAEAATKWGLTFDQAREFTAGIRRAIVMEGRS